jgi:uroporphyrinogen-III synthase
MAKPGSTPTLAGWYVISLRPSGGHAPVRRAAARLGARVLPLSTLKLAPLDAGAALTTALACNEVVFTSPAAVLFASRQARLFARPGQHWLAVGSGTARALQRAGIATARAPEGRSDSEALLELPELRSPEGRDIGLVTAPGGRGLIAETLARRGARVHVAPVYRREPVVPRADRLRAALATPPTCALLVSSAEAFDGLWPVLPADAQEQLRQRPVVASSPRLAVMLAARGFGTIVPAAGAAPSRMLDALAADVAQGRFR